MGILKKEIDMQNKVKVIQKGDGRLIYVDQNGNMYYDSELKQPINTDLHDNVVFTQMKYIL